MTPPNFIELLFWFCLVLLFYTFAGYPLLIGLLSRISSRKFIGAKSVEIPTVTVVLAAYNEEARMTTRLQNLLSSDYPKEKLDIVVVSDGSTDDTEKKVQDSNSPRIQLLVQEYRCGKAHCLNLALAVARGEIVVFADTRQCFTPETVSELARHFNDPRIGAVSGALQIETAATSVGGESMFIGVWKSLSASRNRNLILPLAVPVRFTRFAANSFRHSPKTRCSMMLLSR